MEIAPGADDTSAPTFSRTRSTCELFLISVLVLFLELACIRWFPSHVVYLTFFTNTVLLACFLGMSAGCLIAGAKRSFIFWTPALLAIAFAASHWVTWVSGSDQIVIEVGHQGSPQFVFFGTEYKPVDIARFVIPIEAVGGCFFLLIALAFIGPGQQLGRALNRLPNRVQAYTINILGSAIGIVLFAGCAWLELPPFWWFLPALSAIAYFVVRDSRSLNAPAAWVPLGMQFVVVLCALALASFPTGRQTSNGQLVAEYFWSPYYRVDYNAPYRTINVNMIGHQTMVSRDDASGFAYALPHLLARDSGRQPFGDVLIIGAGSGNDVSRALQWGAKHIDAVEIDPVIQRLGQQNHPDRPYEDERVRVHLDDGRNFLRASDKQYDLIVYALVDSLVLHSSYSNIRLESYLFTRQAFADVRRHLKPDGLFVMYNYFRQGWIVARLHQGLTEAFGTAPLVLTLPYLETVAPEQSFSGFTMFFAGETRRLGDAFGQHPEYWLRKDVAPIRESANGFATLPTPQTAESYERLGLANVIAPAEALRPSTDDWPFLYLRKPVIPNVSLRGAAVMGGLALVLLFLCLPSRQEAGGDWALNGQLFFLGAGFMLIETKAVVHLALLFGSTWMVNSVVFFAVLIMILAANLYVLAVRPVRVWPYYVGLLAALALNIVVPLDFFLGMSRGWQVLGSCVLVFTPILFAGVVFAVAFAGSAQPDRAFAANIAGAMAGGLAEYSSMLVGFRYLVLVALAFYVLSALFRARRSLSPGALLH